MPSVGSFMASSVFLTRRKTNCLHWKHWSQLKFGKTHCQVFFSHIAYIENVFRCVFKITIRSNSY